MFMSFGHTHVDDVWGAWADIWHVSRTRLNFAKLYARNSWVRGFKGNEIQVVDRPRPNGPSHPHSQPSAEDASFLGLFHQGAGVGQQAQGRGCAGHPPQVVVGVVDTAGASIRDIWSFSTVEWEEAMEGWRWRTWSMPVASLKANANRIPTNSALCTTTSKSKSKSKCKCLEATATALSPNPNICVATLI